MSERVHEALDRHFKRYRIVFWYDPDARMREVYESYCPAGVGKIELANDELRVRHRLLREDTDGRFLIYSPGPKPPESEDWLLDLALGNFVFSTDEASMYSQEAGLPASLEDVVSGRIGFFRDSRNRLEPLKVLARPEWREEDLLYAMLSLAVSSSKSERLSLRSMDEIVRAVCAAPDAEARWVKVREWKLDGIFFDRVRGEYGISLDSPEPRGVLIRLFQGALSFQSGENRGPGCQRAFLFLDGWRDAKSESELYESVALILESETRAREAFASMPDDSLVLIDIYKAADQVIVGRISESLASGRADLPAVLERIRDRVNSYWYRNDRDGNLRSWYDALEAACRLELSVRSFGKEGPGFATKQALWDLYTGELHIVDRLYRRFVMAYQGAGSHPALAELLGRVDDLYLNGFLEPLARSWQNLLDADAALDTAVRQSEFFRTFAAPYLDDGKKLFVIVSDGLRWEAGVELAERVRELSRYRVETEPLVALVPTYTPHGMAALLPHDSLALDPASGAVRIDGAVAEGIEGRSSHLSASVASRYPGLRARAIRADELLTLSAAEADREIKEYDLVYVYSDQIDSASHASDAAVPRAVDNELGRIVDLVRRITSLNRPNILVTSDHGFLFSGNASEESFMLAVEPLQGESYRDRRFILGMDLAERPGLGRYGAPEPAFGGAANALVAKGLTKIRKQGGLGRYIHGGATLQELAIPVIRINKTRVDDARKVDVSVLGSNDITSPSIALKFFQDEPVGGKTLPHRIAAWFESSDGQVISNRIDRIFDSADPSDLNRSDTVSFAFAPAAKKHVGREVLLRLSTVAEGGALIAYRTIKFRLKQIALDIDFF